MTPRDNAPEDEDQDAEPTMTAPQEGRPDGLTALDEPSSDDGGESSP
jgi:hypothetical protein